MQMIVSHIMDNINALSNIILVDTQLQEGVSLASLAHELTVDKVFIHVDAQNCVTEEQFCNKFVDAVKNGTGVESVIDFGTSLSLPQRIAIEQGQNVIVWIDGFDQINNYDESIALQRLLRSHWQKHTNVVYCLCGSNVNFMAGLYVNPDSPFYMFGSVITK